MSEPKQETLNGDVETDEPTTNPGGDTDDTRRLGPECCVDGCDTQVLGLNDGWSASNRDGVACNDCWSFYDRHNHWPDLEAGGDVCVECLLDDGAYRHDCPEWDSDVGSVILRPGSECHRCGEVPREEGDDVE